MRTRTCLLLIVWIGVSILAGCSKFKSSQRLNLAPFAEDMIAVAGDIQYGLGQNYAVYLRSHGETPEYAKFQRMAAKVRLLIRSTIAYALEVVTLADSRLSGPERTDALADRLDSLVRPVVAPPTAAMNMSSAELDTILADVRDAKSLLDGLAAAQPIINEVARISGEIFEDTKTALDAAATATQRQISADVAPVLAQDAMLRGFQWRGVKGLDLVQRHWHGDPSAMDSLAILMPGVAKVASSGGEFSIEEMTAVEQRIVFSLQTINEVRNQLRPDVELFWRQQAELEELVASFNKALRQARVAMVAWSRAHQRLASGITDPSEIDIFGIAKKAAGDFAPGF